MYAFNDEPQVPSGFNCPQNITAPTINQANLNIPHIKNSTNQITAKIAPTKGKIHPIGAIM